MGHIPIRMCIVCRERYPKKELKRYVKEGGKIIEDKKGVLPGRGFYVCRKEECLRRAEYIFKRKK